MRPTSLLYRSIFLLCFLLLNSVFVAAEQRTAAADPTVVHGSEGDTLKISARRRYSREQIFWDLNGGSNFDVRGRIVTATFVDNGTYTLRFKRISLQRAASSTKLVRKSSYGKRIVQVANAVPSANIGGPYSIVADDSLQLAATVSDRGAIDEAVGWALSWDFGDGTALEQPPLSGPAAHSYSSPGEYTVSLVARDKDGGLSHVARTYVTVAEPDGNTTPPTPSATPTSEPAPPGTTVVHPQEIFGIIPNPGMGWQSTDIVNSSGRDAQGFSNKVAYIKYYWKDLETAARQYNWSRLDQHLAAARASKQKVALRIVVVDNITSGPAWLRDIGAQGTWIRYTPDGSNAPQVWSPRLSDSIFLQEHAAFMTALGNRYDGHPDIDSVDIGSVGWWGEWHFFAASPSVTLPNVSTLRTIIDQYRSAFSTTSLVAQLENVDGLTYAVSHGTGFRGDCLGNVPNQMQLLYEPNIAAAHAENAWQNGPINFETCWNISYWVSQGFNLRYIFDWALAHHISGIANKNSMVPNSAIPEVERLLKRMGYRYVLRELRHPQFASAGDTITVGMNWENIGVAPSYGNYRLAFQLKAVSGALAGTFVTPQQIKSWMPGAFQVDSSLSLPVGLQPGFYTLTVGVVDPVSGAPAVQLSINGRDSAGWYPLSTLEIR